jgi:hypothetical protein
MTDISSPALEVLSTLAIDGNAATITAGHLDRPIYEEVDTILKALNGKWNKSAGAHVFPFDPTALIEAVIESGVRPPKNPHAFFPTPPSLVREMLEMSGVRSALYSVESAAQDPSFYINKGAQIPRILEPSAGVGGIAEILAEEIGTRDAIDLVELDPLNAAQLRKRGFKNTREGDFLALESTEERYRLIVMNPPFKGREYQKHIRKAWDLLDERGVLVAIVPSGFVNGTGKSDLEFLRLVCGYGNFSINPEGSFKDSGTMVDTSIVIMEKEARRGWHDAQPDLGYPSLAVWQFCLWLENDFKSIEERNTLMANLADDQGFIAGEKLPAFDPLFEVFEDRLLREAQVFADLNTAEREWVLKNWAEERELTIGLPQKAKEAEQIELFAAA